MHDLLGQSLSAISLKGDLAATVRPAADAAAGSSAGRRPGQRARQDPHHHRQRRVAHADQRDRGDSPRTARRDPRSRWMSTRWPRTGG
ncbi:hypothetical protein HBB16_14250 [Pseudonocardia sp. MCCB 268]|nr:hypothetical protein [Pseudonocardia cytotoxica]